MCSWENEEKEAADGGVWWDGTGQREWKGLFFLHIGVWGVLISKVMFG